jgi:uncharacterized integral membrane protein
MALSGKVLRAWIWAKLTLMALVLIYTTLFVYNNSGATIELWYFFNRSSQVPQLLALVGAFLLGGLLAMLIRMVAKTIRQMRRATEQERTERLEREIAEMRTKASTLRTREEPQQGA